ncbi:hypothetical protein, partial [Paenibacillus xylanexedens]|uniref:hypothetical protein n=1 Tax=Paenibacillus xylanexedens TaxID=528191 RepID=UPI003F7AAA9B
MVEASEELGYVGRGVAGSFGRSKRGKVGVVLGYVGKGEVLWGYFLWEMVSGIGRKGRENGM